MKFTALLDERDPGQIQAQSVEWSERRPQGRAVGADLIEVKFPREGSVHLPVSRQLKLVEQKILSSAGGPVSWRLPISLGVAGASTGENLQWPQCSAARDFLDARASYFEAVRQQEKELVTQGADLCNLRPLVVEYASKYLGLIQDLCHRAEMSDAAEARAALTDLRRILSVDSVCLSITDFRGRRREATLVAPTHPLRALWLSTWAELGVAWLELAKSAPREFNVPTRDAILKQLAPVGFPPVIPLESGTILTAIDNLNPFWTLYAPSYEEDPRGLLGEVCAAFSLPEPAIGGTSIDGAYLASRVKRYLLQHPYVNTLTVNAFNAGRGSALAEMLLCLQKMPEFANIHYDLRLFVPEPEAPYAGETLRALLSPSGSVTGKEADAFAAPTGTHLYPKLRLSIRSSKEFKEVPELHSAHLSILFDVFPAEDIGAVRPTTREFSAPVHGLVRSSSRI